MAAKNSRKIYVENTIYHVYNRGVEKRTIFADPQDYNVFLGYLGEYLLPKNEVELYQKLSDPAISYWERDRILKLLRLNNFAQEIDLISHALMPNHIHFLLKQGQATSMDKFMNSLMTRFAGYFNRKYQRVGCLFQDVYKAVPIISEAQLLHVSRYIHNNPLDLGLGAQEHQLLYTSLPNYLGNKANSWVKPQIILDYFSRENPRNSYASFIQETDNTEILKNLILE